MLDTAQSRKWATRQSCLEFRVYRVQGESENCFVFVVIPISIVLAAFCGVVSKLPVFGDSYGHVAAHVPRFGHLASGCGRHLRFADALARPAGPKEYAASPHIPQTVLSMNVWTMQFGRRLVCTSSSVLAALWFQTSRIHSYTAMRCKSSARVRACVLRCLAMPQGVGSPKESFFRAKRRI